MDTFPRRAGLLGTVLAASLLLGCGPRGDQAPVDGPLRVWTLPAPAGSAQPDLSLAHDGRLLLSWLHQRPGQRASLQFAEFGDGMWGPAKTIAVGSRMVVNWADTPHILATPDGALWAQWLQTTGEQADPHAYHVILSTSRDGGVHWATPVRVHADDSATEHGFAALWPASSNTLGIAWLDGAAMAGDAAGRMRLQATTIGAGLASTGEASELTVAASTCECCQTDVALTARGPVLVWRGRDEAEVRDIHISRLEGEAWRAPTLVHADGWQIEGCPVNGPAVAAAGQHVLVGWFTGAGGAPGVRIARSSDAGESFAAPVEVDTGNAVLGRVDVALDADSAWLLWLRQDGTGQALMLARFSADLSREIERVQVAAIAGADRSSGVPKLALRNGVAYVAWTDQANGMSQVRGASYTPPAAGGGGG